MVFSSAIFLFAFLPAVCLLYRIIPGLRAKNILLIAASLIFYGTGNISYIPLLLTSVLINYVGGRTVTGKHPRLALVATLALNLGILAVFKYLGFFAENLNLIPGIRLTVPVIALPIGISFFTFQGMSYVIDVYREPELEDRSFFDVLLYISFFPQLVAGPIVKYKDISELIRSRECTPRDTAEGIRRFILGLSKKLLIADAMDGLVAAVYGMSAVSLDARLAWLGVIAYSLQIYFDFSGYSDMAIGLGRMFGFRFRENFDHPYTASSIKQFWRKWHISLSSWFRDYLYIPLGGNRKGTARTYINKFIVFFLTGLWHGANWTFVLWGLWHGLFAVAEDTGVIPVNKAGKRTKWLGHVYTMLVVVLGFALFRADSVASAGTVFAGLVDFRFTELSTAALASAVDPHTLCMLILGCLFSLSVIEFVKSRLKGEALRKAELVSYPIVLLLFVLDILHLASASYVPFIYFQF